MEGLSAVQAFPRALDCLESVFQVVLFSSVERLPSGIQTGLNLRYGADETSPRDESRFLQRNSISLDGRRGVFA